MAEKVTTMVLKVDLQCSCCYKKIKKLLCKFPQIRNQIYDEKQNQVTITVVCCSPEKLRDKLRCKGGKVIKSIEIKEPPKPKPKPEPEPNPEPKSKPKPEPEPKALLLLPLPPCCGPCSEGYAWGTCYHVYGRPTPPPPLPLQPCYDVYGYGYGGGNKRCYVSRCDYYFSEENPQGCTIM